MDDVDNANDYVISETDNAIKKITGGGRYNIPPGKPGECDLCGEYSTRLIKGACAPCRDKYGER